MKSIRPIDTKALAGGVAAVVIGIAAMFMPAFTEDAQAARRHGRSRDYEVKEQETITKTFTVDMQNANRTLDIDNIWGSVEVVGGSGNQVEVTIQKSILAEDADGLARAKKEVVLDITQPDGGVRMYVDGPFRCNRNCGDNCDGINLRGDEINYIVKMDFKVKVPEHMKLKLRTVNEGNVNVRNVIGDYRVNNVNGSIDMVDIGGSGKARTVNGHVKISFRENPKENSDFGSINGDVEIAMAKNFAADLRFKTFNGGVFSDYQLSALPAQPGKGERKNGRFVFRSDRYTGGRVGAGGPEIRLENLNGDIRVVERHT